MAKAKKARQKRPLGVTIICVLGSIVSILFLLIGYFSTGLMTSLKAGSVYVGYVNTFGSVSLLFGITGLFAYWLLWRMKKWGMIVAVILNIQFLIFSSMLFYSGDISLLYVIWPVAVTAYLCTKRKIFR